MAFEDLVVFEEALAYTKDGGFGATDSIKAMLITNAVVPTAGDAVPGRNAGATTTYTEVAAGGSYTAGGEVLDTYGNMVTEVGGTMTFGDTGANVVWAKLAGSPTNCRYAVIYNSSDTGLERAICFVDLGSDRDLTAGSITITWHASGMWTVS